MPEKLSFVIPCYNSEHTIAGVIKEIEQWLGDNRQYDYEVIAVNDCSPDCLGEELKRLAEDRPWLKVVELAINGGKHAAMMAGYRYVRGDIIVNLDDDGQCPMDQLSLLLEQLRLGADIALARYPHKRQSTLKNIGSKVNEWMARVLIKQPKGLQISNFSVLRRIILNEILRYQNPYPYLSGLFLRSTSHIVNVDMEERERTVGRSGYTFKKSFSLWLNGFTAFSVKPLRIASVLGVVCALSGFLLGLLVVIRKLLHPEILAGYSSFMAALLFIGGMILMMLGMLGEYVGRIYICINNSPQYVVRGTINCEERDT